MKKLRRIFKALPYFRIRRLVYRVAFKDAAVLILSYSDSTVSHSNINSSVIERALMIHSFLRKNPEVKNILDLAESHDFAKRLVAMLQDEAKTTDQK